ncbi:hypothetical protein SARC_01815 [Sphaeroforma arctica JP610]|uniref:Uncharacterized protein n=1 Tax=Sphaeroforma arctica JP610 TaxID=667725 RepID=A0A0L0GAR7_9EUKA|nr:hypothetical protein SARC_01815 [Sphaeroforma arctica JP610]KNC86014.1 hypothetical protein SARC_01815 [Sphaeroforma arctica JP610]|eukprot:XP_014159916.1 hypothetical protein SARC_01815 [Sphaeroforma arctica JP610]
MNGDARSGSGMLLGDSPDDSDNDMNFDSERGDPTMHSTADVLSYYSRKDSRDRDGCSSRNAGVAFIVMSVLGLLFGFIIISRNALHGEAGVLESEDRENLTHLLPNASIDDSKVFTSIVTSTVLVTATTEITETV